MKENNYILEVYSDNKLDCPEVYWYIKAKAAKEAGNRLLQNKDTNITAYRVLRIDKGHYKTVSYKEN